MDIKKPKKVFFSIIGKKGSTFNGNSFIQASSENAKEHCEEIERPERKVDNGNPVAMSDFSRQLTPWEFFSYIFFNDKISGRK